jgi:hypothetical protein
VLELPTFTLLKYSVEKNLSTKICRRNVLSTKCLSTKICRRNACRQKFVDEMYCRRNVLSTKCLSTKVCRQNVSTKMLSTKCFSTKVSLDEKHRIRFRLTMMEMTRFKNAGKSEKIKITKMKI